MTGLWRSVATVISLVSVPPGIAVLLGCFTLLTPVAGRTEEKTIPVRGENERIRELKIDIEIRREGTIAIEQTFRIGVAGAMIKRGPILSFLTVFQGPGGLTLDKGIEIEKVLKEGTPEPFRVEKRDGFITIYIGSPEIELEHREHTYSVLYRTDADWRQRGGEFSTVIDAVHQFPVLPIDRAEVRIRLPEGVTISKFTPAITGFEESGDPTDPGFTHDLDGGTLTVRTTRPLGENKTFFLNLAWPSGTFATRSQWLKVMTQHPRIPLAAFSAVLLVWALTAILLRAGRRQAGALEA